jgi:large subunit ribosomal protein L17
MKDRAGGYTRILKLGERSGDAAEVVILELVDYQLDVEGAAGKKAKKKEKTDKKAGEKKKADEKKGGGKKEKAAARE